MWLLVFGTYTYNNPDRKRMGWMMHCCLDTIKQEVYICSSDTTGVVKITEKFAFFFQAMFYLNMVNLFASVCSFCGRWCSWFGWVGLAVNFCTFMLSMVLLILMSFWRFSAIGRICSGDFVEKRD